MFNSAIVMFVTVLPDNKQAWRVAHVQDHWDLYDASEKKMYNKAYDTFKVHLPTDYDLALSKANGLFDNIKPKYGIVRIYDDLGVFKNEGGNIFAK